MEAKSTDQLKARLINLLRSREVKLIKFKVASIKVSGVGYARIAELLDARVSNNIRVEVNPGRLTGGKQAEFVNNVFVFKSSDWGTGMAAGYEQGIMLHEATHALVANTLASSTDVLSNEMAAFIAQFTWYVMLGGSITRSPIEVEASKLAPKVFGAGTNGYNFDPGETASLAKAIKAIYNEAADSNTTEETRKIEFIEPRGQWEVHANERGKDPNWPQYKWIYNFVKDGLSWHNKGDSSTVGYGGWVFSRADGKIKVVWYRSTAKETWNAPANSADGRRADYMWGSVNMSGKEYELQAWKL